MKFNDEFTNLQKQVIGRLAEIEEEDRRTCEGCGGEDCQCCEIYHDRQRWVSADQLFRDDIYENEYEPICYETDDEAYEDNCEKLFDRLNKPKREYPCDTGPCPYSDDPHGTYFCRDHCGLGVDD